MDTIEVCASTKFISLLKQKITFDQVFPQANFLQSGGMFFFKSYHRPKYHDCVLYYVQPLLCNRRINNGVMQPISRERIGKHIFAATNTHATIEEPVSKQRIGKDKK
jgi:hypothetical protein